MGTSLTEIPRSFESIYGVDFSGAKLAGGSIWVARIEPVIRKARPCPYLLTDLTCLEDICGTAERAASLAHLVRVILESRRALWAIDFPFGLPIEAAGPESTWSAQFDFLNEWGEDAYGFGL